MGDAPITPRPEAAAVRPETASARPERIEECNISLSSALAVFLRFHTAQIIIPLILAAWVARIAMGHWRWWDLGVVAIVGGLEAFTEWVTHVFVLHYRPRPILGRERDLFVARKHRQHHADPKDLTLVFIPLPVFLQVIVLDPVIMLLALPTHELSVTAIAATYTMLGIYEWTHFLIHAPYRPRGRYYSYVRRAHWLHHYKNENYWFGITVHLADYVMHTFPDKADVEKSPTARTLGVD